MGEPELKMLWNTGVTILSDIQEELQVFWEH